MKEWHVCGNKDLSGSIEVGGAKNALVAILPAVILTRSIVKLENVTPLQDTYVIIEILKRLGVRVIYDNKSKIILDARNVKNQILDGEEMKKLRASYYFMGTLISLYKDIMVLGPGGCKFSERPIDLHLYAFECLGCKVELKDDLYCFKREKVKTREIKFKKVSVGATVNAILASCKIKGNIKLINVAKEPEVDDLISFLNKCGANIRRSDNTIFIKGVNKLSGCEYKIMQDRIEAGTYLIIGACVGKGLRIHYNQHCYLQSLISLLKNIGVDIVITDKYLEVSKCENLKDTQVICDVYPQVPTDLQQPLSILMSRCTEVSILKDKVYPSRYTQIEDLNKMGFNMKVDNGSLCVYRSSDIHGERLSCKDLRGGASLVIASLIGKEESVIENVYHIERGYFDLLNKLKKVGARVYEKN